MTLRQHRGPIGTIVAMPTLTPRDTSFLDEAPVLITTTVEVDATPDEVWEVLTDNERWPEWFPAAKACRTTSDPAGGIGATRWIHFDLFKVDERFIVWDPPREWAFTIVAANLPGIVSVVERYRVEETGETTTVHHALGAELAPYMRPLAPFLRWRNGTLFRKGLAEIEGQVARLRDEQR
jgi:uncharacterized protein YndB with AHSA1/START domain